MPGSSPPPAPGPIRRSHHSLTDVPRHLTKRDIEVLVTGIDTLAVPTWKEVVKLAKRRLRHAYSRQALSSHARIRIALATRKTEVQRQRSQASTPKPDANTLLLDRIASQDALIARLNAENAAMMTRFAVWTYNAHVLGIPDHRLDAPIRPVDRNHSEDGA